MGSSPQSTGLATLWAAASLLLCLVSQSVFAADNPRLEAYLDGLVAAQFNDYDLAGLTLAIVENGQLTLARGYGYADIDSATPVDPARHLFRPGSVSKLFTWTAVMQLVEQGKLDLNADVSTYVDQFPIPDEFGVPLTLTHIMTHTPGLEDGAAGFLFGDEPSDNSSLVESLAEHTPTQVRPPGTYASYSNWATALAGLIVANVSGLSFEAYIDRHLFDPLNMRHSTFDEPLPANLAPDMSTGYTVKEGGLEAFPFEYIKDFGPAGALSASATDMANFMIAHLDQGNYGDRQILQPGTVALMHEQLFSHDEHVAAMAHGFYEIWRNGQRFIGHGGDTIAFHSQLVLDPGRQFGFFLSFNAADGAEARSAIVNGIIDYFYPPQLPQFSFTPIPGSAERVAQVVGAYRVNRRSYTQLEGMIGLAGDLPVAASGDNAIYIPVPGLSGKFVETEPFVFSKVGRQEKIVFDTEAGGAVKRLFVGSVPILVADRMPFIERAATHQLIIGLALLAALFVVINWLRNWRVDWQTPAGRARLSLVLASLANLLFAVLLGVTLANLDMKRVVFDFPPAGVGFALLFPILSLVFTLSAVFHLLPVWRTPACGIWARLRYTYVTALFVLLLAVLHYWNMIGWKY